MLIAWQVCDEDTVDAKTPQEALDFIMELCGTDIDDYYPLSEINQADYGLKIISEDDNVPILTIKSIMSLVNMFGIRKPFFLCSTEA